MKSTTSIDIDRRHRLREVGLRITTVRLDVLRVLDEAESPLNAQEVHGALPEGAADRVTVYRTLHSFEEKQIVHRIDAGDRVWRFSLARLGAHDHPHLVCDECGAVECLDDAQVHVEFPGCLRGSTMARRRIREQDAVLHGRCARCARDDADGEFPPASGVVQSIE